MVEKTLSTELSKFTVVPGVQSRYQLLMKPVVYTVKQEAESMSSGRDAVAEDCSMRSQPLPSEVTVGGGDGGDVSSVSHSTG